MPRIKITAGVYETKDVRSLGALLKQEIVAKNLTVDEIEALPKKATGRLKKFLGLSNKSEGVVKPQYELSEVKEDYCIDTNVDLSTILAIAKLATVVLHFGIITIMPKKG